MQCRAGASPPLVKAIIKTTLYMPNASTLGNDSPPFHELRAGLSRCAWQGLGRFPRSLQMPVVASGRPPPLNRPDRRAAASARADAAPARGGRPLPPPRPAGEAGG